MCYTHRTMQDVLFLSRANRFEFHRLLSGVYDVARQHRWNVHTVDNLCERKKVAELLSFWNPIGCIAQCGGGNDVFEERAFGRTPVVFIDRDPATLSRKALLVTQDSAAAGHLAARELLAFDYDDYGFVDRANPLFWSVERREAFRGDIRLNGRRYHPFPECTPRKWKSTLIAWLRALPRPVGLFATNDMVGEEVINACTKLGLDIPKDVALIGLDNAEMICENTRPTLSSISPDTETAGRLAAELLARKLTAPRTAGLHLRFGQIGVIRRESSRTFVQRDKGVATAVEWIRRNTARGVTPSDVIRKLQCSRRLAEMRFRKHVGMTILDTIHESRIDLAKKLVLDGDIPISALHAHCGFKSPATLRRVFTRLIGASPLQWRAHRN